MTDLAEDLRRYADRAAPVTAGDAAARGQVRRRRHRLIAAVTGGVGAAAIAAVVVMAVAALPDGEGSVRTDQPAPTTTATTSPEPPAGGGIPGVTATVEGRDLGPLRVTLGPIVAPQAGTRFPSAWAQHEIRLENTGTAEVTATGPGTLTGPAYLGRGVPPVHAGDRNCSFRWDPTTGTWGMSCLADLMLAVAPPGGTAVLDMHLYRKPDLEPGTYTFAHEVRWWETAAGDAATHQATVEITYTITDAAA